MAEQAEVYRAKEAFKGVILGKPNVVGVGQGYKIRGQAPTDELCVVVLVRKKLPKAALSPQALVPQALNGVPTDIVEVGDLVALQARTDRWRPAPGGVSIGHFKITAGTLGAVVRDRATGERFILSNNHVLANSNDAAPGDPILQPGPADGGRDPADTIATLERFVPIEFQVAPPTCGIAIGAAEIANGIARVLGSKHRLEAYQGDPNATNRVDAALARPVNDADLRDDILDIGTVSGITVATLGMTVRKSGRTTEFTTGQVTVLDATVDVSYGPGQTVRFEGQIVATAMSQGGDSGSLVVAGDSRQAVGLLFAGSSQATIINPIQEVLDLLGIDI